MNSITISLLIKLFLITNLLVVILYIIIYSYIIYDVSYLVCEEYKGPAAMAWGGEGDIGGLVKIKWILIWGWGLRGRGGAQYSTIYNTDKI
tara:strand:- start:2659 stop:2931 length:273 start_codon:yes stop_codon:yes gene_type:complete